MTLSSDPINNLENLIAKNKSNSISIYIVVVLAVIVVLGLLPIIKVDISSQSRGMVRSKTDNVPITSLVSGKISKINLRNNAFVKQNDTLFIISNEMLESQKQWQDTLSNSVNLLLQDVTNLLKNKTALLRTTTIKEDFYKFQAQKSEWQSKVSQAQTNYDRYKILFDKGVVAKMEFEKYVFELRLATQGLQSYVNQQKATWENQKQELSDRIKNHKGNIDKIETEAKNYVVLAPTNGTIENFIGLQVGSFINASQPMATLSPEDNLIVENTVSPNDIGLLHVNQKVKFQLDAFNYNQWGLLEGKVIDIDKNITMNDNRAFFKVRCSVNNKNLKLKSGYKTAIAKGMTLTTRYIITRRSLYDLLFDKVDDWLNPKIISGV